MSASVPELRDTILAWAAKHHEAELLDGVRTFLGETKPEGPALQAALAFALIAAGSDGTTLIERWAGLARRSRAERQVLEAWAETWFSLLRVVEVRFDEGLLVHDVLHERRLFVHERSATRQLVVGDWLAAFYFRRNDRWEFEGTSLQVPGFPARSSAVQEALRVRAELGATSGSPRDSRRMARRVVAAVRSAGRAPRFQNADGHDLELVTATLHLDWSRVLEVVSEWPDAVLQGDHVDIEGPVPVEFSGGAAIRAVFRKVEQVELFANSRERFDAVLARWKHQTGSPLPIVAERIHPTPSDPRGSIVVTDTTRVEATGSPEDARESFLANADARWPDLPIPVLGGQTPREAVAAGRTAEVWALLDAGREGVARALGLEP